MSDHFDSTRIFVQNREFEVRKYYDGDRGRPWEESEGHGPVREIRACEEKRPGERVMSTGGWHPTLWAYDVQEATKIARRAGWGAPQEWQDEFVRKNGRPFTRGEKCAAAVAQDFEFLNAWVTDQWQYIGVCVMPLDAEGEPDESNGFDHALWGIESTGNYWREAARELAQEIIREDARKAVAQAAEAAECAYWNARGVETVGA